MKLYDLMSLKLVQVPSGGSASFKKQIKHVCGNKSASYMLDSCFHAACINLGTCIHAPVNISKLRVHVFKPSTVELNS